MSHRRPLADYRFCRCGLAMYAIERHDGTWVYVCEDCDPDAMARVERGPA